ncbi:MAG TPA: hypothetical protein VLG74_16800 [Blastocatellia bacterium]|nr:hypothetical protein [Blastocatellia bacterium]
MEQVKNGDDLTAGQQPSSYRAEPASIGSPANSIKETVAGRLHDVAGVIQQKASQNQNTTISAYAGQAANWLDDAAEYVREADPQKLKSDVQNQVRRNPGRSLLAAGAAGLLLGFLIRR